MCILFNTVYTYIYPILCIVEAKAIMPHAATAACKCSAKPIRGRETAGGAGGLHCGRTEPQSKQKAIAEAQRACRPRPKSVAVPGRQAETVAEAEAERVLLLGLKSCHVSPACSA